MIKVECTWGQGPDILVVGENHSILNMSPTTMLNKSTYGCQTEWQLDLTTDQADQLAYELLDKIKEVKRLEAGLDKLNEEESFPGVKSLKELGDKL